MSDRPLTPSLGVGDDPTIGKAVAVTVSDLAAVGAVPRAWSLGAH